MEWKHKKRSLPSQSCDDTASCLVSDLNQAKKEIDTLLLHLNYYTDPDLIDSYTYQLKGAYLKYRFFLRQLQTDAENNALW